MKPHEKPGTETVLLNGEVVETSDSLDGHGKTGTRFKRLLLVGSFAIVVCLAILTPAHALDMDVFEAIFSSIQNDMGTSLKDINQITQSVQKLYQTTMWPLAAINQARGFVSNSISSYRGAMSQIFSTRFSSATLAGPQQFESILHSRLSTKIHALQASFTANFGAVPQANMASPQDRVMMDIDDALGQENLKTTLISDEVSDTILDTAGGRPHRTRRCVGQTQNIILSRYQESDFGITHATIGGIVMSDTKKNTSRLLTPFLWQRTEQVPHDPAKLAITYDSEQQPACRWYRP